MVDLWLQPCSMNGILLPTSFEILVSDVIHGYVLPIVRISLKRFCHDKATDFIEANVPIKIFLFFVWNIIIIENVSD